MFICVDSYCTIYWKKKDEGVNENEVCVSSRILFVIFVKVRIQIIINIYPYIHKMINERGYRREKVFFRNSADRMNDTVRIYDTKKNCIRLPLSNLSNYRYKDSCTEFFINLVNKRQKSGSF